VVTIIGAALAIELLPVAFVPAFGDFVSVALVSVVDFGALVLAGAFSAGAGGVDCASAVVSARPLTAAAIVIRVNTPLLNMISTSFGQESSTCLLYETATMSAAALARKGNFKSGTQCGESGAISGSFPHAEKASRSAHQKRKWELSIFFSEFFSEKLSGSTARRGNHNTT
jgi:hypothetical protein